MVNRCYYMSNLLICKRGNKNYVTVISCFAFYGLRLVIYCVNKHLMGYLEFLHGWRIISLPFNISERWHSRSPWKARGGIDSLPSSLSICYNTTQTLKNNFIHLSLNSGSAQVQNLLVAYWRFAMVTISYNGPGWK